MLIRFAIALVLLISPGVHAADRSEAFDKELQRIVAGHGPTPPIAGAALAVMIGDRLVYSGAAGCAAFGADGENCARPLLATSKLRVASISKMALAMGLMTLVEDGAIDLDRDISDYLGWRLANPAHPDRAITARQLLSHMSSIRDPEEYWVAAPGKFRDLFESPDGIFAGDRDGQDLGPGRRFAYANLNYGILAAAIEGVSQTRFDLFMTDKLFRPAGLDIGYNWSGVSSAARRAGAALPKRERGRWTPVVDGPAVLADDLPYFLASAGIDRAAHLYSYQPGDNPTLFSPQGGLRASVKDLALLARSLSDNKGLVEPVWSWNAAVPNGDTEDGYFAAFGLGVQTVSGNEFLLPGLKLVGHAGEAYGLYSGAWLVEADEKAGRPQDISFAFAATGVDQPPARGSHPTFNAIEERLVRLAMKAAETGKDYPDEEPRPFDETADAMQAVDAALLAARASGKRPLLILGGNWCHDSRGLAKKLEVEPLRSLIASKYLPVWVDVGHRDRNLGVASRFGVEKLLGTPTVLILSPEGDLLNAESVHDWRTADSKSLDEAVAYFESFAESEQ